MAYSNGALNAQARRVGNPEGVVDSRPRAAKDWSFFVPEGEIYVDVKSRLQINNGFGVRYAALAGAGIVMQRAELVADDIAEGRLQPLLSNYKIQSRPRHIVWLENRRMTPKLRAFIDFVAEVYGLGFRSTSRDARAATRSGSSRPPRRGGKVVYLALLFPSDRGSDRLQPASLEPISLREADR